MDYKESDWKLFKKLIPGWQEKYIAKLNKEYIDILTQDKEASAIFEQLSDRIKKDKSNPGVIIEMRRSKLIENLALLISYNVITFEELNNFSDDLKESVRMLIC